MQLYAIIVAGGSGNRMGSEVPKQFLELAGKPILMHSIEKFYAYNSSISIIVVLPEAQQNYWKQLCTQFNFTISHQVVNGGQTRFHSVKNGLGIINDTNGIVAIHDGVRPFVSTSTLNNCFDTAAQLGNATPALPLQDSIRLVTEQTSKAMYRGNFKLIQTPQCFKATILKKAFEQEYNTNFTDDASVVEAINEKINLVEGNIENIKITTPFDLAVAEAIIRNPKI